MISRWLFVVLCKDNFLSKPIEDFIPGMKVKLKDLYLLSRNSDLSETEVEKLLKAHVHADKTAWHKFFRVFFASLGIAFAAAGVVFFFAYNWQAIHKFVKFGIIEGGIVILAALVLATKLNLLIKNILLTGLAVMVGVMFAVFGQVYQTGANAYDFFLGWTLCISLWVIVSNFAPLWLLYLVLINTTFLLYADQEATGWTEIFTYSCLFYFNTAIVFASLWISERMEEGFVSGWFVKLVSLASLSFSTIAIILGIFDDFELIWLLTIFIALLMYSLGTWYGLRSETGFFIAAIAFSVIIVVAAFLVDVMGNDHVGIFLVVSVFIISSVTLVIRWLLNLQKKWSYAQSSAQ